MEQHGRVDQQLVVHKFVCFCALRFAIQEQNLQCQGATAGLKQHDWVVQSLKCALRSIIVASALWARASKREGNLDQSLTSYFCSNAITDCQVPSNRSQIRRSCAMHAVELYATFFSAILLKESTLNMPETSQDGEQTEPQHPDSKALSKSRSFMPHIHHRSLASCPTAIKCAQLHELREDTSPFQKGRCQQARHSGTCSCQSGGSC